ncbi:hypothetical protein HMPREF0290_1034 [Corynebacterium efficiens YS-314]|uniref:Uncharacterized protein n=1 Tax=Corynebacterium efficiens (strain DSM 44549 / YS-314 / AJ 12310 / JCM 11189 / NBRC 100395) TaxID=196164 RepID=Q8FRR4_COREF|nr:hypothetical protein HMPREF0290_1034 [Corynebacterium efficiens YS-314]BAC17505.1 hypothetical protein [Corynebacterium efficiens YS-314]
MKITFKRVPDQLSQPDEQNPKLSGDRRGKVILKSRRIDGFPAAANLASPQSVTCG